MDKPGRHVERQVTHSPKDDKYNGNREKHGFILVPGRWEVAMLLGASEGG